MLNSYPWYISDWRNSETRWRLDGAQRGLYRELLDYCYLEGSLPDDRKTLWKIAGWDVEMEVEAVTEHCQSTGEALPEHLLRTARARLGHDLSTVLALFKHDPSTHRYTHPKVDEIRVKLFSYHEQKRHAGVKSGQARRKRAFEQRSEQNPRTDEPFPSPSPYINPLPPLADAAGEALLRIAGEIWDRHPPPHRNCTAEGVREKLKAIMKHKKVHKPNWEAEGEKINATHRDACASEQWTKDGGQWSAGLRNWLIPKDGQYELSYPAAENKDNHRHATMSVNDLFED